MLRDQDRWVIKTGGEALQCREFSAHGAHYIEVQLGDNWGAGRFCDGHRLIEADSDRRAVKTEDIVMTRAGRF